MNRSLSDLDLTPESVSNIVSAFAGNDTEYPPFEIGVNAGIASGGWRSRKGVLECWCPSSDGYCSWRTVVVGPAFGDWTGSRLVTREVFADLLEQFRYSEEGYPCS